MDYNYYRPPFWKRKVFYILLFIFLIGVVFVYWSISRPVSEQNTEIKNDVTEINFEQEIPYELNFTLKKGNFGIKSSQTDEWDEVTDHKLLKEGDFFKTYKDSNAVFEFSDQLIIRLDENTEIEIKEFNADKIVINQLKGNIFYRFNPKKQAEFIVNSQNLSLVSDKSVFNVDIVDDDNIKVYIFSDSIRAEITEQEKIVSLQQIESNTYADVNFTKNSSEMIETNDIDLKEIEKNSWFEWNHEQDVNNNLPLVIKKDDTLPKDINLTGYLRDSKVYLEWAYDTGNAKNGFRILMSEDEEPVYPDDESHYLSSSKARSDSWSNLDNGTYHFRVGIFDGEDKILLYSNDYKVEISEENEAKIELEAESMDDTIELNWEMFNLQALEGYRILIGEKENPSFSNNLKILEIEENDTTSYSLEDLDADKEYHIRVCKFFDNNCVIYSNDVMSSADSEENEQKITLNTSINQTNVDLVWNAEKLETNLGFRVLMSENSEPILSNSTVKSIDSVNTLKYQWTSLEKGKTYYFRVCEYIGENKCGSLSNVKKVKIPEVITQDKELFLNANFAWGKIHLTWTAKGLDDIEKYYTIIGENPNLLYPASENEQVHDIEKKKTYDSWTVENGKTYYVKVCAFKGGYCEVYSNEVSVKSY